MKKKAKHVKVSRKGEVVTVVHEGGVDKIKFENCLKVFVNWTRAYYEYLLYTWYVLQTVYQLPREEVENIISEIKKRMTSEKQLSK